MSNFTSSEFDCKCGCGETTTDLTLRIILEDIREHFGAPVTITSAKRCKAHNADVGGVDNSRHLSGEAADIKVKGIAPEVVYDYINASVYGEFVGMGLYNTFVHVDVRGFVGRW